MESYEPAHKTLGSIPDRSNTFPKAGHMERLRNIAAEYASTSGPLLSLKPRVVWITVPRACLV